MQEPGAVQEGGPREDAEQALAEGTQVAQQEPATGVEVTPDRSPGRRQVIALLVVAFLVGLDLWSKAEVMPWLEQRMPEFPVYDAAAEPPLERDAHGHLRHPIAGNWLAFMHGLNHGAAFGRLGNFTGGLVVARVLASILLTVLILRTPRGQGWNLTSMVLILAGALGNLYDNLFYEPTIPTGRRWGPVRDFIDVYFENWDYHFATFNVADACITVGAVLLLLSGFFGKDR